MSNQVKVVVLAAGQGTRMKSDLPKVLHPLGHRPMVEYVLDCAERLNAAETILVVNPGMREPLKVLESRDNLHTVYQEEQLGTAHAVLCAREHLEGFSGTVLVLFGDTPNLSGETLERLLLALEENPKAAVGILGMYPEDKHGYARVELKENGRVKAIIEQKDATDEQLALDLCNSGVMALRGASSLQILDSISNKNAAGEYYLTDAVRLADDKGFEVVVVEGEEQELAGVNSKNNLAEAENFLQNQWRSYFLEEGVTLVDPNTVYFSHDTQIGKNCVIEPNVVMGPGVQIQDGVTVKAFSYLSQAKVGTGCSVGPFAHLRPGASLEEGARVGNFVEVKNSTLKAGAKANHLAYIGDSEVGAGCNIGAGTITCNYDGFSKNKTVLGDNVFVGSNSSLVAPVRIEADAIIGAGSVITKDVPQGALAVGRGEQKIIPEGGIKFRQKRAKQKTA